MFLPDLGSHYDVVAPLSRDDGEDAWLARTLDGTGMPMPVVIRRLPPGGRLPSEREAFVRRRLAHPNLVRFFGAEAREHGGLLVREHVEGVPWSRVLARHGERGVAVPIEVTATVLRDVVRGLAAMPVGQGHGGVDAERILVGTDGRARLLPADEGSAQNPREDVWRVGILLWEALVGRPLAPGLPTSPSIFRLEVPDALDELCQSILGGGPQLPSAVGVAFALDAVIALLPPARLADFALQWAGPELFAERAALARAAANPERRPRPRVHARDRDRALVLARSARAARSSVRMATKAILVALAVLGMVALLPRALQGARTVRDGAQGIHDHVASSHGQTRPL